jgi:hypothetical protein
LINFATIKDNIAKGISATEVFALIVLAAGTDASNELTRSGRKAISTALGISRRAADAVIDRLIAIGAIVSLEEGLENRRDPTALRFRLVGMGQDLSDLIEENVPAAHEKADLARLPNAIVQNTELVSDLRRALNLGGLPAMVALLEIAIDPAGAMWPPAVHAAVDLKVLGNLGTLSVAEFSLPSPTEELLEAGFGLHHGPILVLALCGFVSTQRNLHSLGC